MGLLSNGINRQNLKPGDHIYAWRHGFIYSHHGIYIGNDKVIHFTESKDAGDLISCSCSSSFNNIPCPLCGFNSRSSGVVLSCIDCFLKGGYRKLYLFEYRVSKLYFLAKLRSESCSLANSDPLETVLHRANVLLESNRFGKFCAISNNCEDFAIYCKTGLIVRTGISGQSVNFGAATVSGIGFLASKFTPYGAIGVLGSGASYCFYRWANDVGVRDDVDKFPVERLVEIRPTSSEGSSS